MKLRSDSCVNELLFEFTTAEIERDNNACNDQFDALCRAANKLPRASSVALEAVNRADDLALTWATEVATAAFLLGLRLRRVITESEATAILVEAGTVENHPTRAAFLRALRTARALVPGHDSEFASSNDAADRLAWTQARAFLILGGDPAPLFVEPEPVR